MKTYSLIAAVLVVLLISVGMIDQSATADDDTPITMQLDCTQCHYCETPTAKEKCLRECPRHMMTHIVADHDIQEAPDTITLGLLADQYQPVKFDHKAHANMAEMGLDCATCHHYSPPGRIPSCRECHGGEANPNDLRQPALKGAYHRQCLSCHREWSHDTKCVLCHLPAHAGDSAILVEDPTDIMGISHPVIIAPDKKVYHTGYEEGPLVTFYHKEHVELYGLSCANCHKDESCSHCHDMRLTGEERGLCKSFEEMHAVCDDCHGSQDCGHCHATTERPGFSHEHTGWPLSKYHRDLSCRACHPTGERIAQLDNNCATCHAGWTSANFQHAVTGLKLDDIHCESACEDCHAERAFDQKPTCTECHDENRDPREYPPGEWL